MAKEDTVRRKAAVAGQFYQATSERLTYQVQQLSGNYVPREKALGILSPHAGLVYSGSVAGEVYSRIVMPETFVLIGPNHTGLGPRISIMANGEWEIPNAIFQIDSALACRILSKTSPLSSDDTQAHIFEHSLEVQLPFIAHFAKRSKIVPITIMSADLDDCRQLGEGIARSIKDTAYPVLIVASSDMSHYLSDDTARKLDRLAIDRILSIDPEGLYHTVKKERISMCGYLPAAVMLFAACILGPVKATLVKYTTSAEVSGDYDRVVGYAGIIIS